MKSLEIANELYDDVKELCDYYIAGRWNDKKEIFSVKVNNAMFDLIKRTPTNQTRFRDFGDN